MITLGRCLVRCVCILSAGKRMNPTRERGRELTNAHIEWDVWLMSASVCAWLCRPLYSVLYGDIIHSLLYIDGKTETERRHRLNSYCLMCVYYIQIHRCIEKHVEHEQHTHTHIRIVSHAHTHRRTHGQESITYERLVNEANNYKQFLLLRIFQILCDSYELFAFDR